MGCVCSSETKPLESVASAVVEERPRPLPLLPVAPANFDPGRSPTKPCLRRDSSYSNDAVNPLTPATTSSTNETALDDGGLRQITAPNLSGSTASNASQRSQRSNSTPKSVTIVMYPGAAACVRPGQPITPAMVVRSFFDEDNHVVV